MLLPKPLDQIAAADIRSLVENKVRKGDRLEYKENLPKANDDDRVKFLCTVASLANSLGGDIVTGIGERRDGNRRTGELLVKGLNEPGFDFDRERNRLTEMILKGIDPRVGRVGFKINLLKRHVLKRCIYGVDLNPMAVELAKVSLWLDAFTLGAPLSFLDHLARPPEITSASVRTKTGPGKCRVAGKA